MQEFMDALGSSLPGSMGRLHFRSWARPFVGSTAVEDALLLKRAIKVQQVAKAQLLEVHVSMAWG